MAAKAGRFPAIVASNTNFAASDPSLTGLQRTSQDGVVRSYLVIDRGGIRFGLFGLMGKESIFYTTGPAPLRSLMPSRPPGDRAPLLRDGEGGRGDLPEPRRRGERQRRRLSPKAMMCNLARSRARNRRRGRRPHPYELHRTPIIVECARRSSRRADIAGNLGELVIRWRDAKKRSCPTICTRSTRPFSAIPVHRRNGGLQGRSVTHRVRVARLDNGSISLWLSTATWPTRSSTFPAGRSWQSDDRRVQIRHGADIGLPPRACSAPVLSRENRPTDRL